MTTHRTYIVLATPTEDGEAIALSVPELANTSTVALDTTEGEVLVREAIALAIDEPDRHSFEVEIRAAEPGL